MLSGKPAGKARSSARLLLTAGVVLQAMASLDARGGIALDERVLHFPADRGVGKLEIYTGPITNLENLAGNHKWGEWQFFHEARGAVTVPAGKVLRLKVSNPGKGKDLSPLRQLGPNDLYCIVIDGVQGRIPPNPDQTVMPYLSGLTGLKELDMLAVNVSGKGLRHLERMNSLRVLKIYYASQSLDVGLPYLSKLKSLEELDLNNGCTDAGLRELAGSATLRRLSLGINDIQGPGLVSLEQLPALRSLTLVGKTFSNEGLACIKNLRSLTHLHLFCFQGEWPVTDAGLVHLSGLTGLEELEFTHIKGITDAGMVHLKPLRSLKKLDLGWIQITDIGLAQLEEMTSLESLRDSGRVTDAGLAWLVKSFKLKELSIGGDQITDEGVIHLTKLRSLENLSLNHTAVTDAGMDSIAQLTNLRRLSLLTKSVRGHSAGWPTDKGVAKLAALKSLKSLYLQHAKLTITGLSHLNALPNLTELRIGDVEQDNTGMNIAGLTKLEELTIDMTKGSRLGDEDLGCLAQLNNLRNLQLVSLDGNAIGDQGVKHLAGLTNIDTLVIGSKVTDEGLGYLENMKKLERLTLFGDVTDQGLGHLEGLKGLGILRIHSARPFGRTALNHLRQKLPGLYMLEATDSSGK